MAITYFCDKKVESNSIRAIFLSVNWSVGDKPDKLQRAFSQSHKVVTAWDGEKLVGLINSIADGSLTAYIPYLLVNPDYQKQGIGEKLVRMIISEYENYDRIVLLTEKDTVDFYRKCGFLDAPGIHSMMIIHQ
jgi:ribosomal protein S18 acetylase RimI-like enzyme